MSANGLPPDFDLARWLASIGLGEYAETFEAYGVTAETLPQLNDDFLNSIGVSDAEYRKYILESVAYLHATAGNVETVGAVAGSPAVPAQSAFAAASEFDAGMGNVLQPPQFLMQGRAPHEEKKKSVWARIIASKFLLVSILVHLLFGAGATYWIVQRVQTNRKLTFQGGPPTNSASTRALEHQVSLAKKKAGGAPPQQQRIVSTGISKISLPDMPAVSTVATSSMSMMSGMGGVGIGHGLGLGSGTGMGMGSGGGGGLTMFGFHDATGGGLTGEFYDLKQTRSRQPTGISLGKYNAELVAFVRAGWPENKLRDFFKASKKLYAPQFLVPEIDAALAPKEFEVAKDVQPKLWAALYKGKVTAPESGTFHFVGTGDDVMFVKFNNKTVLNASYPDRRSLGNDEEDRAAGVRTEERPNYNWPSPKLPFAKGEGFAVQAGETYPIEVLIGEGPGGKSHFVLLIEKDGENYEKSPAGPPVLPVFRMANVKAAAGGGRASYPPFRTDGPVWSAKVAGDESGSLLDALK